MVVRVCLLPLKRYDIVALHCFLLFFLEITDASFLLLMVPLCDPFTVYFSLTVVFRPLPISDCGPTGTLWPCHRRCRGGAGSSC
jgi:hypothetical protein